MEMHTLRSLTQAPQIVAQRTAGSDETRLLSVLRSVARWSAGQIDGLLREIRYRRLCSELLALDDRLLSDIGVHRSHIDYVVRNGRRPRAAPGGHRDD